MGQFGFPRVKSYLARASLAAFQKQACAVSAMMISGSVTPFVAFMYAMLVRMAAMLLSEPPEVIVPHTCSGTHFFSLNTHELVLHTFRTAAFIHHINGKDC